MKSKELVTLVFCVGCLFIFAMRDISLWQFFVEAPLKGLGAGATATTDSWFDSLSKSKKYTPRP